MTRLERIRATVARAQEEGIGSDMDASTFDDILYLLGMWGELEERLSGLIRYVRSSDDGTATIIAETLAVAEKLVNQIGGRQ